ncbi:hypothetical protein DY000_02016866 [Brassica cretica]|uniref:Uncharacterized protein n=1 Tax=Brassica cretica TaxID=69181 RepID=A0ABQ7CXE6_BRACR|nr:hypothetical protein DY000_02016866 [Brassica cretica]
MNVLMDQPDTQGVLDPNSDVRDPRAAPARDLFLVRDSIRQLASDDQGFPDQATKDVRDPIEATRSIPARVRRSRLSRSSNKGRPRPDRSDSIHSSSRPVRVQLAAQLLWWSDSTII